MPTRCQSAGRATTSPPLACNQVGKKKAIQWQAPSGAQPVKQQLRCGRLITPLWLGSHLCLQLFEALCHVGRWAAQRLHCRTREGLTWSVITSTPLQLSLSSAECPPATLLPAPWVLAHLAQRSVIRDHSTLAPRPRAGPCVVLGRLQQLGINLYQRVPQYQGGKEGKREARQGAGTLTELALHRQQLWTSAQQHSAPTAARPEAHPWCTFITPMGPTSAVHFLSVRVFLGLGAASGSSSSDPRLVPPRDVQRLGPGASSFAVQCSLACCQRE